MSGSRRISLVFFSLTAAAICAGCGAAGRSGHTVIRDDSAVLATAGDAGQAPGAAGSHGSTRPASGSGTAGSAGRAPDSGSGGSSGSSGADSASGTGGSSGSAGASGSSTSTSTSASAGTAAAAGSGGAGIGTTGMEGATSEAGSGTGSGIEGGSGSPATAGAAAAGGNAPSPDDADCNLNGVWIARLTTFSHDSETYSVETTSHWFYYELEQSGHTVTVAKALDCGILGSGNDDVSLTRETTRALLHPNDQAGRHGKFYKDDDHCAFRFDRFYSTRGVDRTAYLPADTSHDPALGTLETPLPTEQTPAGAEDWDEDGHLGIAFDVAGLGTRHVVQRDWNEFWTDETTPVALRADEFMARADFDTQESILATSGGHDALLRAFTTPATDMRHRILFRRVARSPSDAAIAGVRVPDDLDTCYKVQASLPHDPTAE